MCLLALLFQKVADAPLIVGANREEAYARIGEPPQLLDGSMRAVGGRDPTGGGTWLAVNVRGVLIAVTNRPKSHVPPRPRSRGLLVRDLLDAPSAAAASALALAQLCSNQYAGCNLVCGDVHDLFVIHGGDRLALQVLPPGWHVLTARDVDDPSDSRQQYALRWLNAQRCTAASEWETALQALCAQPGNPDPPMCLRGEKHGTVSSSIVVVRQPITAGRYLHAQGPPDRTPYRDCSPLLHHLS